LVSVQDLTQQEYERRQKMNKDGVKLITPEEAADIVHLNLNARNCSPGFISLFSGYQASELGFPSRDALKEGVLELLAEYHIHNGF